MLASICGRLCPAPCERACVFYEDGAPIGIRALERYAADYGQTKGSSSKNGRDGKKVAIVGSGPTGLTAAAHLAQLGYRVTIFESFKEPGGALAYGVPGFRLPRKTLDSQINLIESLGVEFKANVLVGQTLGLEELWGEGYAAILLALGAGTPKFLDIPGTSLGGVYYAEEFLMRMSTLEKSGHLSEEDVPFPIGDKVVVIGGGYAALDSARAARRLGREVSVVFHRTHLVPTSARGSTSQGWALGARQDDMGVRPEERKYAQQEGVKLEPLAGPVEILGDDDHFVRGLKCLRRDFADPHNSGDWQLIAVPDSEFILEADTVIVAVGHQPNSLIIKKTLSLKINPDGTIFTNPEDRMTSIPGVFAAGNVAAGPGSVVEAMAEGKKAGEAMDRRLRGLAP